ncbi:hypothetical protein L1987_72507 [Smallanthus sonchifolius]|uniref:Uncharacterized protein n=1 Tax=Smallanthus sonchifolius TaxID=185202 RepID=A0ACB9AW92_9ASTR|nr:hypothetical protein L1987_72507 [Smallanthus sonchifolius]
MRKGSAGLLGSSIWSTTDHCSCVLRYPCWRWCGVGGSSQLDLSTCFYFSYELFSLDAVEDEDDVCGF